MFCNIIELTWSFNASHTKIVEEAFLLSKQKLCNNRPESLLTADHVKIPPRNDLMTSDANSHSQIPTGRLECASLGSYIPMIGTLSITCRMAHNAHKIL